METVITGSSDTLISSMHFMKSGELLVEGVNIDDVSKEDLTSLQLTQEFILYALDREDWLSEFFTILSAEEDQTTQTKPELFLIKGGLDES